jgi:uncharacterized membrane protein YgdD (TMEM256/DUF423 family)
MERLWVGFGAIFGLTTVAMAAYAAHGLQGAAPATLAAVGNAVQMQGLHALALLFTGLWGRRGGLLAQLAGLAFVVGIVLFCGTIYQQVGPDWLRAWRMSRLAPFGGTTLMLGWGLLAVAALRR